MPLNADRSTEMKDRELVRLKVKANVIIFAGALIALDAGYAAPGSTKVGLVYVGRAEEYVDNTGGADGAKTVLVRKNKAFCWKNSVGDPIAQADVGATCYIEDDETVSKTNAGGNTQSAAGKIANVDATGVWVE
jgi:hypothetical protein